jgi:hypothetical protein
MVAVDELSRVGPIRLADGRVERTVLPSEGCCTRHHVPDRREVHRHGHAAKPRGRFLMLSDKQRRTALKRTNQHARDMARRLRADGVEEITLTHYADEGSFRAMKLPEEGDDFEHRQRVNAEIARVMLAHGLQLKVQVLDAGEYFAWLGARPNTYQALQEYPGGRHVSGEDAKALLGID